MSYFSTFCKIIYNKHILEKNLILLSNFASIKCLLKNNSGIYCQNGRNDIFLRVSYFSVPIVDSCATETFYELMTTEASRNTQVALAIVEI